MERKSAIVATVVITVLLLAAAVAFGGESNAQQTPDLSTSYKTGPATAQAGEVISYTIVVANTGGGAAENLTLEDSLPDGVSLVDCGYEQPGSLSLRQPCGDSPLWMVGSLEAGTGITTTITATVTTGTAQLPLTNCANVYWDEEGALTLCASTTVTTITRLYIPWLEKSAPPPPAQAYRVEMPNFFYVFAIGDDIPQALNMQGTLHAYFNDTSVKTAHASVWSGFNGARVYRSIFLFDLPEGLTEVVSATVAFDLTYYQPPAFLPGQPYDVPVVVSQAMIGPKDRNRQKLFSGGDDLGESWEWQLEDSPPLLTIPVDQVDWSRDWLALHTRSGVEDRPDLWGDGAFSHGFEWEQNPPVLTIWARQGE